MSMRAKDQNAKDAARFAEALAPLRALLREPPLMTSRCAAAVEEAIRELEWIQTSRMNADKNLAEFARICREEGERLESEPQPVGGLAMTGRTEETLDQPRGPFAVAVLAGAGRALREEP